MFATHAVIRATSSAEEIAFTTLIDNYMNAMAKRNTDQALTLFADHQSSLENLNALVSGENYAWFDSYTEVWLHSTSVNHQPPAQARVEGKITYANGSEGQIVAWLIQENNGEWKLILVEIILP